LRFITFHFKKPLPMSKSTFKKVLYYLTLIGAVIAKNDACSQGFSSTPTRWAVPAGGHAVGGFYNAAATLNVGANNQTWTTMDLNTDGRPDLVVHSQGNGNQAVVLGGLSAPHWDVYFNTGAGFSSTPTRWNVPAGGHAVGGFYNAAATLNVGANNQTWTTMDLNTDGRPDLVVHSQGNGNQAVVLGGLSAPHWDVYFNTGAGFSSTPTRWNVPAGGHAVGGFYNAAATLNVGANNQTWTTMDLNTDGRPDLVVHSQGNGNQAVVLGGLSAPHWDVYFNTGAGFSSTPTRWNVPAGGHAVGGFYNAAATLNVGANNQTWTTMDLNTDGRPDLVVHSQGNGNQAVVLGGLSAPHWDVYFDAGPLATSAAASGAFRGYPVPFQDVLTLETENAEGQTYVVSDYLGRNWIQAVITSSRQRLLLADLPTGVYIIRLTGPRPQQLTVVKQ
jgi:hypothetical protein